MRLLTAVLVGAETNQVTFSGWPTLTAPTTTNINKVDVDTGDVTPITLEAPLGSPVGANNGEPDLLCCHQHNCCCCWPQWWLTVAHGHHVRCAGTADNCLAKQCAVASVRLAQGLSHETLQGLVHTRARCATLLSAWLEGFSSGLVLCCVHSSLVASAQQLGRLARCPAAAWTLMLEMMSS